jgi:hypothetical protein
MNKFNDIRQYLISSKTGGRKDVYQYLCVDVEGRFYVRTQYDDNNHPAVDWESKALADMFPNIVEQNRFLDTHLPKK